MEENNRNTEELKKETVDTVNDVKETIKNVNIKKDTIETKGFVSEFFTKPLETIKEIVNDNSEKFFKYAIIILAIWIVAAVITRAGTLFSYSTWSFSYFFGSLFENTLSMIKSVIEPVLTVLTISIILLVFNKSKRKKLTTIITAVTTAYIPIVISEVAKMLIIISSNVTKLTSPFSGFCSAITLILTYFVAKDVLEIEKHSEFVKKFVLIEGCYYLVYFILTFLGIYI